MPSELPLSIIDPGLVLPVQYHRRKSTMPELAMWAAVIEEGLRDLVSDVPEHREHALAWLASRWFEWQVEHFDVDPDRVRAKVAMLLRRQPHERKRAPVIPTGALRVRYSAGSGRRRVDSTRTRNV